MNKDICMNRLLEAKVIPVLRKLPEAQFMDAVDALVSGGISAVEITMDTPRASKLIREVKSKYGDDVLVGAGTVIDETDMEEAFKAGAVFIVSPILDEGVVAGANTRGVPVVPGVFSPTEVVKAIRLGADMVKIFPANTLGPAFIKNIKGPLGDIPIMCTGGIDSENAGSFVNAGAKIVGAGSSLLKKSYFEERDWEGLADEVKEWMHSLKA